jgi:hypothetical protein
VLALPPTLTTELQQTSGGKRKLHARPWTLRTQNIVSSFSTARKIIRLGHVLEPWSELWPTLLALYQLYGPGRRSNDATTQSLKQKLWSVDSMLSLVNSLLSCLNDVSDDVVALAKIGVIDKPLGQRFEPVSNWLWLSCIALDLYAAVSTYKQILIKKQKDGGVDSAESSSKEVIMRIQILKLFGDLGFCSYDVLDMKFSPLFQATCALISGYMGMYKLYLKALPKSNE